MTRDRGFKRVVRARMRRTGESYTAALVHVRRTVPPSRPDHGGGSGMYPFERFTERAKKVLTLAQEEAERAHHSYIGTEHLLLGLLREEEGIARLALDAMAVDIEAVRKEIDAVLGREQRIIIQQIIPTSRVKKVIEIAFEEARRLGVGHVGTEHLLLGLLIEGEGVAAKVLDGLGVTLERTREEIGRLLEEGKAEPAMPPGERRGRPASPAPEVMRLMGRATMLATTRAAETYGLDHLLETIAGSPAGVEALARLLDLRRAAAAKEQALAAADFEAATGHRAEEQRAREALAQAVTAWRAELVSTGPG